MPEQFLSERAASDPSVPFTMGIEQRYPLRLSAALPTLARLYADACVDVWDPEVVVDTAAFAGAAADDGAPVAAGVWAWAARREYAGIAESSALLVRMCIESQREPEVKYLLTTRGQARALAAEACWTVASALGPPHAHRVAARTGHGAPHTARGLLHARVSADVAFVGHVLLGDAVATAWWQTVAAVGDRAATTIGARVLRDRQRMVDFGWAYLETRLGAMDDGSRAALAEAIGTLVADLLDHPDLPDVGGGRASALGAPPLDDALRTHRAVLTDAVARTRALGLAVPAHPRRSP